MRFCGGAVDGARVRRFIEEDGVTIAQATPSGWRIVLQAGVSGAGRRLLCGGEALAAPEAQRLLESGATVWQVYGPTETTI